MSQPDAITPLTMTAERESWYRSPEGIACAPLYVPDLLAELDATRALVATLREERDEQQRAHVVSMNAKHSDRESAIAQRGLNADMLRGTQGLCDAMLATNATLAAENVKLREACAQGNRRLGYWCDLHGSLPEDRAALGAMQEALAPQGGKGVANA